MSNVNQDNIFSLIKKPIPEGKKRFEQKMILGNGGQICNAILIDEQILDWSIDMYDFTEAAKMGPKFIKAIKADIVKHFVESVSDFLGRKVTIEEINMARKNGYI